MTALKRFFLFLVVIAAVAGGLKLLNWVPLALQDEGLQRYRTIDDAGSELKLGHIAIPAYFPQYLRWPPAEVYAQRKPFSAVLMHFTGNNSSDIILAIRQAESGHPDTPKLRMEPQTVSGEERISLKGRPALLVQGICPGKQPCNAVTWQDRGFSFTVVLKDSVKELLRVSESMLAEQ
jgi:hypothetical protein